MQQFKLIRIFLLLAIFTGSLSSLALATNGKASIKGKIRDSYSKNNLEYANVALFNSLDSTIAGGTITNAKGYFEISDLSIGAYFLKTSFIGFDDKIITNLEIVSNRQNLDLGIIELSESAINVGDINIEAERTSVVYKIDKKVVNVGSDLSSSGGTAVDALENVPSVKVDMEGNVQLRGSSSFTVLIDGRPSVFEGADALKQIPVSTIENIEIITNPSAKYNASGTAGILNVITKKEKRAGSSGMINIKPGSFNTLLGDFTYNLRTKKLNLYVGGNYGHSRLDGCTSSYIEFLDSTTTNYSLTEGDRPKVTWPGGIDIGIDYQINDRNTILIGAYKGWYNFHRTEDMKYTSWNSLNPEQRETIKNFNEVLRNRDYYTVYSDYERKFDDKGHKLQISLLYKTGTSDEISKSIKYNNDESVNYGQQTTEENKIGFWRTNIDYTKPLAKGKWFQAGYEARTSDENELYAFENYNHTFNDFSEDPLLINNTDYLLMLNSAYAQFSGEWSKLGYQLGLRGEHTHRTFKHSSEINSSGLDRFDIFPSLHLSYQLPKDQQLLLSYSRRITRPTGGKLEPFETWLSLNFKKLGNPDLNPEYSDAFELSWMKEYDDSWISFEAFLRRTTNDISVIQQQLNDSVLLYTYENFGDKFSLGTEFAVDWNFNKWWNLDCSSDLYYFNSQGHDLDYSREQQEYSWNVRMRNNFKLWKKTKVQLGTAYIGPSYISQGTSDGYFISFLVVRRTFLKNNLSVTLRLHDLLQTGKQRFERYGTGFYNLNEFSREAPTYHITIAYRFNRMKRLKAVEDKKLNNTED